MAKYKQHIDIMGVFLLIFLALPVLVIVFGLIYIINAVIKVVTSLI
jgi:hypothetical protein